MTVKAIATLKTDVASNINDNNIGDITPADVRSSIIDSIDSIIDVSLQKSNNLSDLSNVATARSNLGLVIGTNVQAFSNILENTTASFTTAIANTITTNTNNISSLQTQATTNANNIATNTNTINDIKTKTDFITVSQNVNLNTLNSYNRTTIQNITTTGSINSNTVLALVNSTSDVTVTLPLANSLPPLTFINVKRLGTGNVIIALNSSDTLDGLASSYNFNTDGAVRYSNRRLTTDGVSNWYLI